MALERNSSLEEELAATKDEACIFEVVPFSKFIFSQRVGEFI